MSTYELEGLLEKIEGHLGHNWKDEYPGIQKMHGEELLEALRAISDELEDN